MFPLFRQMLQNTEKSTLNPWIVVNRIKCKRFRNSKPITRRRYIHTFIVSLWMSIYSLVVCSSLCICILPLHGGHRDYTDRECTTSTTGCISTIHGFKVDFSVFCSICLKSGNMKPLVAKWPCCFKDIFIYWMPRIIALSTLVGEYWRHATYTLYIYIYIYRPSELLARWGSPAMSIGIESAATIFNKSITRNELREHHDQCK